MGWASGSILAASMVATTKKVFKDKEARYQFYRIMIEEFEALDCDTMDEALGIDIMYDKAYNELYPRDDDE
ncbi:hypothetical protein UFOVP242_189 [uncultured Caudovirales phage]|uniref:Uncharacterized protein n=1 Tax=uncultured Caudovirales phage TaxID=2100421 RepID=A0A6J7WYK1_9CAUD|nr:hypothetical protein UFOVP242_189 [uncultured Caudovirales phage]